MSSPPAGLFADEKHSRCLRLTGSIAHDSRGRVSGIWAASVWQWPLPNSMASFNVVASQEDPPHEARVPLMASIVRPANANPVSKGDWQLSAPRAQQAPDKLTRARGPAAPGLARAFTPLLHRWPHAHPLRVVALMPAPFCGPHHGHGWRGSGERVRSWFRTFGWYKKLEDPQMPGDEHRVDRP